MLEGMTTPSTSLTSLVSTRTGVALRSLLGHPADATPSQPAVDLSAHGNASPLRPVYNDMTTPSPTTLERAEPAPGMRTARIRCLSNVHAVQFAQFLGRRSVVIDGIEDADVVVSYTGSMDFVAEIAGMAMARNFADASVVYDLLGDVQQVEEVLALVS